jgi:hypothetical protein
MEPVSLKPQHPHEFDAVLFMLKAAMTMIKGHTQHQTTA